MNEVRLTLIVSEELDQTLEDLSTRAHCTKSATLRKALALFDFVSKQNHLGLKLAILDQDNQVKTEIVGI